MFRKRAQAAMEFLMTYGWAILVVLVAIGALAYFGVLSPDKFLPEQTTGPSGLDAIDKAAITSTGIGIGAKNNLGYKINIVDTTAPEFTDEDGNDICGTLSAFTVTNSTDTDATFTVGGSGTHTAGVKNGESFNVKLTCASGSTIEGRVKGNVKFSYVNTETGLEHQATYYITGVVPK